MPASDDKTKKYPLTGSAFRRYLERPAHGLAYPIAGYVPQGNLNAVPERIGRQIGDEDLSALFACDGDPCACDGCGKMFQPVKAALFDREKIAGEEAAEMPEGEVLGWNGPRDLLPYLRIVRRDGEAMAARTGSFFLTADAAGNRNVLALCGAFVPFWDAARRQMIFPTPGKTGGCLAIFREEAKSRGLSTRSYCREEVEAIVAAATAKMEAERARVAAIRAKAAASFGKPERRYSFGKVARWENRRGDAEKK